MEVRIRIPEMFKGRSVYAIAKASGGRIHAASLYRLAATKGEVRYADLQMLQALADVCGVTPRDVLTNDPPPPDEDESPAEAPKGAKPAKARAKR